MATGWQTAYPLCRPSRLQAEGLPRAGLRAGLLPGVGGAGLGGGDLPDGLSLRDGEPVADGDAARPLRRHRGRTSSWEWTTTSTGRRERRASRRPSCYYARPITPRRGDRAGDPCACRVGRDAGRTCGSCCSVTPRRRRPAFDFEFAGIVGERSLASLYNARDGGARAVAHQLLAHPEGDDGLRAAGRGRAPPERGVRVRTRREPDRARRAAADRRSRSGWPACSNQPSGASRWPSAPGTSCCR